MGICDKARKILWARSGNCCAICQRELVIAASSSDKESIAGEECHIVSGKVGGPRYDSDFPSEQTDAYDNLILLCRVHHKMVDDQSATYTADILRQMKVDHEKWVSEKLKTTEEPKPIRLRQIKNGTPEYLARLTSGKDLLNVVENANAFSFDHDELFTEEEVNLVGGFLQIAQDWGDLSPMESYDRVRIAFELTESIKELEDAGFFVFGGREIRVLEGGTEAPSSWPIAVIKILRKTNKGIIKVTDDNRNP